MMRFLISTLLFSFCLNLQAFENDIHGNPDLFVTTKLRHENTTNVINELTNYLTANNFFNPFELHFTEPILFVEKLYLNEVAESRIQYQEMLSFAQGYIADKYLDKARVKIFLQGLGYKLKHVSFDMIPRIKDANNLLLEVDLKVAGIKATANTIKLDLQIPHKRRFKNFFSVEMITPSINIPDNLGFNMNMIFKVAKDHRGKYKVSLEQSSTFELEQFLAENLKHVHIKPNIALETDPFPLFRMGNRITLLYSNLEESGELKGQELERFLLEHYSIEPNRIPKLKINAVDIKSFITRKENILKKMFLNELIKNIEGGVIFNLLSKLEDYDFPTQFKTQFSELNLWGDVQTFTHANFSQFIALFDLGMCTDYEVKRTISLGQDERDCFKHLFPYKHIRKSEQKLTYESLNDVVNWVDAGHSDIALSLSEKFVSSIVKKSELAGHWKYIFKDQPFILNPNNPQNLFITADKTGDKVHLYLDLIYNQFTPLQRFALMRKTLRFAVKFVISFKIIFQEGVPILVAKIDSSEDSKDFLKYGAPEYGLHSDVRKLKLFQKRVIKEIRKELKTMHGSEFKIPFTEIAGMDFSQLLITSDGKGRINLMAKFSEGKFVGSVADLEKYIVQFSIPPILRNLSNIFIDEDKNKR